MGKEPRIIHKQTSRSLSTIAPVPVPRLLQELGDTWQVAGLTTHNIVEQGRVQIIVRTPTRKTKFWVEGMAQNHNEFVMLLLSLKRNGYMPDNIADIIAYIKTSSTWSPVSLAHDTFKAGDCLLFDLQEKKVRSPKANASATSNCSPQCKHKLAKGGKKKQNKKGSQDLSMPKI